MSYDLTFFSRKPGLDPMVAYREHQIRQEQLAGNYQEFLKRPVDSEERAEIERIATALEACHAAFDDLNLNGCCPSSN